MKENEHPSSATNTKATVYDQEIVIAVNEHIQEEHIDEECIESIPVDGEGTTTVIQPKQETYHNKRVKIDYEARAQSLRIYGKLKI